MNNTHPIFLGNCATGVAKQAKYRVVSQASDYAVEVVIETGDGFRLYPTSGKHSDLIAMVNRVKQATGQAQGGQFYINEYRQVIVPAGNPVEYYLAGEYSPDVVLNLEGVEFSGRPLDDQGNLLTPGQEWTGRPRPGMKYTLKAGGQDIEYTREISPGKKKISLLSKFVGAGSAKRTAGKISRIRGARGGPFYVNEYRALFAPVAADDGWHYAFLGILSEDDPWFPKWQPEGAVPTQLSTPPVGAAPTSIVTGLPQKAATPEPRSVPIVDGATGFSFDLLFGPYLRGAKVIKVEDPYMRCSHQVGNFLRFCELAVRIGSASSITLVTKHPGDESFAKLDNIRRSLDGLGIKLEVRFDEALHDRKIVTDNGWIIHIGRGLDIYKRPENFLQVGATDFLLRPCYATNVIYERLYGASAQSA